jgi:hypothetical protein
MMVNYGCSRSLTPGPNTVRHQMVRMRAWNPGAVLELKVPADATVAAAGFQADGGDSR